MLPAQEGQQQKSLSGGPQWSWLQPELVVRLQAMQLQHHMRAGDAAFDPCWHRQHAQRTGEDSALGELWLGSAAGL